jgi:hypothetical protein
MNRKMVGPDNRLRWVMVRMQLIATKYFEGPRLWQSWYSQYISVSFSNTLVPQLQIWHPKWLVCVQCVVDLDSPVLDALQFLSHGDVVTIVKTQRLDCVVQHPIPRTSAHQYQLDLYNKDGSQQVAVLVICVFHNRAPKTEPCSAQSLLRTSDNLLRIWWQHWQELLIYWWRCVCRKQTSQNITQYSITFSKFCLQEITVWRTCVIYIPAVGKTFNMSTKWYIQKPFIVCVRVSLQCNLVYKCIHM